MNEKPILFSTPMVKAIMAGEKIVTRRVVKNNLPENCPYGEAGTTLWVRETWAVKDGAVIYRADHPNPDSVVWQPSIFMRKKICRLKLFVNSVWTTKLWNITHDECIAEGCKDRDEFQSLWIDINGQKSWEANPLVWVVLFTKIEE